MQQGPVFGHVGSCIMYVCIYSGGVGGLAGPALAGALFDEVMNINIELQQDHPTLRWSMHEIRKFGAGG